MNLSNLCRTPCSKSWMALIDDSPYALYVFNHYPKSRERKPSKLFMSIFKLFRKNMVSKAVWKLISMFAFAHFIPPCTPFCFKATERKVEPQLNSNGDAIKCRKTERRMWLWGCLCITDFLVSVQRLLTALQKWLISNVIWYWNFNT